MDYMRGTYKAKMRFWDGDPTEVEVQWFLPDPTAKLFEAMCSFRSRHTWQRGESVSGVGEVTGLRYPYVAGPNILGYQGQYMCGSVQATFGGGIYGRDVPIITEADGSTPCCFPPPPPPPPEYQGCNAQTGYTQDGATWPYSFDVAALGRVGFLIVHSTTELVLGVSISGWSIVYDQAFTPATDPFFTGKHRVTIYRRVFQAGDAGSTFNYPATPSDPGTVGAFMFSVTPPTALLKAVVSSQSLGGTMPLPTLVADTGDLLIGRWMALSAAGYNSPSAGSPSPVCFVTRNVGSGQTWNPHVGIRDRTIQEVMPGGTTPAYSIALPTAFGDSVVLISALFG